MDREKNENHASYASCSFVSVSLGMDKDCGSNVQVKNLESGVKNRDASAVEIPEGEDTSAKVSVDGGEPGPSSASVDAKATVTLAKPISWDFAHVIVYLPRYDLEDGTITSVKGIFKVFAMDEIQIEFPLTDFELERGMYKNKWRTTVKPVSVKYKDGVYLEASLFARVRVNAQMELVLAIAGRLTRQLEVYKDHIRDGIAQEWCAQEHWRMFPRFPGQIYPIKRIGDGRPDLREILRDLLPEGFDTEWPI